MLIMLRHAITNIKKNWTQLVTTYLLDIQYDAADDNDNNDGNEDYDG